MLPTGVLFTSEALLTGVLFTSERYRLVCFITGEALPTGLLSTV